MENSFQKSNVKKCILGCTEDAFSGCTKTEFLRTRWSKNFAKLSQKSFTFILDVYFTVVVKKFLKSVGELQYLLILHPKSIFRCGLKKAIRVTEDRSYQMQYFAKNFPIPSNVLLAFLVFTFIWRNQQRMHIE